MRTDRAREAQREVQLPAGRPAARFAKARDAAVAAQAQPRPQHLARVVVEAGAQVNEHVRAARGGEAVAVHADARADGELGAHRVVIERDRVVTRLRHLALVAEARGIAAAGVLHRTALEFHVAGDRHEQHIAQVRVPGAREMRMREADDGVILVAIARRPAVGFLARPDLRVRTELDHAEGHDGTRKRVAVAAGADEGVDGGPGAGARARRRGAAAGERGREREEQRQGPEAPRGARA
jgi:hypothetical protein